MLDMAEDTPRVVLLGNTAPTDSDRHVEPLDDVDLDELRSRHEDPDDPLRGLVVDEDKGIVGMHERAKLDGVSVTRVSIPADMGPTEAVATILRVYESDHSDDPPEWVFCEGQPVLAELIADHYDRQGHKCEVGVPDGWERKRSLNPAAKVELLTALGREDELNPPMGGGATEWMPEEFSDEFRARWREHQLRTNAGADFQSRVMGDTASTGTGSYAAANYIGLTENATAPAAGDTTLAGELTTGGLGRAQAVYAHTNGTQTYTLTRTFTSSDGTPRTINKIGVFNAVSSGTMVFTTAVPSPPSLVSGDSLTITETVNLANV